MVLSVLWISLEAAAVIAAETSLLFFLGFLPKFVHIFTPITVSSLKYAGADSIASAFPRVSRLPLKAKSDYFAEGYSPLGNDSDQESDMVMKELALSIFFVFFSFTYAQFFFLFPISSISGLVLHYLLVFLLTFLQREAVGIQPPLLRKRN
jgi:hypothetical protein